MAVTVEDGSIVTNADSYVSDTDFVAHAANLGVTFPTGTDVDVLLRKAAQFIDSHEARMKGSRVQRDQALAFPRSGVVIDGWTWAATEIPRQVVLAQLAVALDVYAGIDPYNPEQASPVIKERVEGAVEVAYANPTSFKLSKTSSSEALINALLKSAGMTSFDLVRA